jgi:hypothetical protein
MANILGNGSAPAPKLNVDLSTSKPMICEECGYDVFIAGTKIRVISKLVTGTDQDMILPIDVFCCGNCGEVNQKLLPQQIRELERGEISKIKPTDGPVGQQMKGGPIGQQMNNG